ncbi:hypothetical protein J3458_003636 [Metarhizium acridum]|uniref:uncharacterized protein n=1 Tax=Metarhizium acridum TaxID=92637 RepID=UPI001C6D06ED|nr:hypothetical protein J3458_003636 [Metarhizium acridum]
MTDQIHHTFVARPLEFNSHRPGVSLCALYKVFRARRAAKVTMRTRSTHGSSHLNPEYLEHNLDLFRWLKSYVSPSGGSGRLTSKDIQNQQIYINGRRVSRKCGSLALSERKFRASGDRSKLLPITHVSQLGTKERAHHSKASSKDTERGIDALATVKFDADALNTSLH